MTFDEVLQKLRPGAEYRNTDGTLAGVAWADGVTPPTQAEYDAVLTAPPANITPLQLRRALDKADKRAAVEAYVAQAGQGVKDAWEYASSIEIDDPLLVSAAAALGVNLADLFRLAATFPRYR